MTNDVKWTQWQSIASENPKSRVADTNSRSALLQLIGCIVGLAGLTVVLPGPASWIAAMSGQPFGTRGQEAMGDAAEAAIMLAASVFVWFLLAWVVAVWIAGVAGRLPGVPGRCGRSLLGRIAPASVGRFVAAAVGVSLIAGTSACAVPAISDAGPGASIQVAAESTMTSTPAPLGGGAGVVAPTDSSAPPAAASSMATPTASTSVPSVLDDVIGTITIDWPSPETPAVTADLTTPATTAATTPTEPAATSDDATSPAGVPHSDGAGVTTKAEPSTELGSPSSSTDAPETQAPEARAPETQAPQTQAPTPDPPTQDATRTDDDVEGPTTTKAATPTETGSAESATPRGVQVRAGDTLWSIAHHHLEPDATDQEIDTAWRAWYSVNAQVIGDNPDLIQPGQLLLPPYPEMGR